MRRRLGGAIAIVMVIFALVVAGTLREHSVVGSPRLPADAVTAGACVGPIDQLTQHPVVAGTGKPDQSWSTATYAFPVTELLSCGQPHAGRVLAVDYSTTPPTTATTPQMDELDAACQADIDRMLAERGLTQVIDRQGPNVITWDPALQLVGRSFGPDRLARLAGEHWTACAMISIDGTLWGPDDLMPGQCTAISALDELAEPGTSDSPALDDAGERVGCYAPHRAQIVAIAASIGGTPTPNDLRNSCLVAAAHFIGVADPEYGGLLAARVIDTTLPLCLIHVAGSGNLDGSILNLRSAPLPWAG